MTYRRINDSVEYARLRDAVLAGHDGGEDEIHAVAGDCCVESLTADDVVPITRADHDATGCTAHRSTSIHRRIQQVVDRAETDGV